MSLAPLFGKARGSLRLILEFGFTSIDYLYDPVVVHQFPLACSAWTSVSKS